MIYSYFRHVALALARYDGNLLLVEQRDPKNIERGTSWWLPGGKIEQGEEIIAGLKRELREETGLNLLHEPSLVYVVQVLQGTGEERGEGLVFFFACELEGEISPQDPDGMVVAAHWIEEEEALGHLSRLPWFESEPLQRWLHGEVRTGQVYTKYRQS